MSPPGPEHGYGRAGVDRNFLLWTLVVFFGSSVAFSLLRNATEGEPLALRLGVQVAALALIIAAVVAVVKQRR